MANTRVVISLPADAAKRLQVKLATMTQAEIDAAFGVPVLSVNFPEPIDDLKYVEDNVEQDRRAGKRG